MNAEVWAAWAGAVVALAAAVVASIQAGRANSAARRSAAADERAAAAAERANELTEEASRYVPGWQVTWSSGDTYLLTNESSEVAYDVAIRENSAGAALGLRAPHPATVGVGEAVTFMAGRSFCTRDDVLLVTWRRTPGDEVLSWRHPLPGSGPDPTPRSRTRD